MPAAQDADCHGAAMEAELRVLVPPRRQGYRACFLCWPIGGGTIHTMNMNVASNAQPEVGRALSVDADFPGGNVVLERIDGDSVLVHQDLRDTTEWWFYWHFRVRGGASRTLTFQFTQGDVIGTRGPAVSTNGGASWRWLGRDAVRDTAFTHTFAPEDHEVRFAFALPYTEADLDRFRARFPNSTRLRSEVLCRTRKGREAELLHIGRLDGQAVHRVLLTCRHHACESIASYVLEGLMETVLAAEAQGDAAGGWLRDNVEFLVVPFVDKDGVEEGDQGKLRYPRDHNRDYDGDSVHATTGALRAFVPAWSEGKLKVALDLHCPWIRGEHNEVIYFVGGPDERNWAQIQRFSAALEDVRAGQLPYHRSDNLPFGQGWNTAANTSQGRSFGGWARDLPGIVLASTLETPYANVYDQTVTPDAARALGRDLAHALCRYLAEAE